MSVKHQLVIVPTSPPALSLAPNSQLPFNNPAVLYSCPHVATNGAKPAGAGAANEASAANVPVNGAAPPDNGLADVELIVVLTKYLPYCPRH